jgi:hypothetical protein
MSVISRPFSSLLQHFQQPSKSKRIQHNHQYVIQWFKDASIHNKPNIHDSLSQKNEVKFERLKKMRSPRLSISAKDTTMKDEDAQ